MNATPPVPTPVPTPKSASPATNPCRQLEAYLQRQWQLHRPQPIPLQFRCSLQGDRLLVLGEHNPGINLQGEQTLAQLALAVRSVDSALGHGLLHLGSQTLSGPEESLSQLRVGLYLRVQGEAKPYAARGTRLKVPNPVVPDPPLSSPAPPSPGPMAMPQVEISQVERFQQDYPPDALGELEVGELEESGNLGEWEEREEREPWRLELPLWAWGVGAGLCLSAFVGSFGLMLQPCLIRACTPLIEAEQIAQAATLAIGQAQNWQDLQTIEDQFDQAQTLLDQVPWWSQYHDQAVELGQRYEDALASFEPIIQAFEQAIEAVNKSQDPPHSIETWQVAQNLWTEAISQLEAITPDNPTYPLAQLKHRQYQGYLEAVGRQLQREQEARQTLENAEQSATLARNHQEDARSLAAWRNARSHWEIAIRALDSISRETTAFLIAQERLKIYHAKLAEVEDGESDTLFASNLYNQALDKAQEAKAAEAAYQWDRAAMRWQVALAAMQKIPQESDYYDRAQDQIENYMSALWQAQLQAQGQNLFGQIQQELGEICAGVPTICHFEISKELITVHLTLEYEQAVLSAGVLGDEQSQAEALDKLQALETALESMSDRSQMPLELYDPDGTLVGTHTPSSNQPDHEQPDHKQPDQPLNQVDRELWTPLHARLHQTLRQRSLLPPGQRLLIGVSGGQDSLCLLRLIWDLCSKWHWSLGVIHCDHGWAGDQQTAQAVERYVQRCYGLELYQRQAPMALPSEGKARQWRYQMFQEVALAQGFDRVLTAHTASDRAETLLHHLLRGSGMDGLSSLPWQRDLGQRKWERGCAALPPQFLQESNGRENRGENRGKTLLLVRPLLNFSRAETGKFCRDQHIPVWQDPHNDDRRHTRNRIRLDLLPYLQQQFNPQTERHLAQTVELLAADVAYLEQQAEILRQQVVVDAPPGLKRLPLQTAPLALQRRVVRQFLRDQLPHHPNFAQIEKVVQLIHAPNRCQTDPLSGGAIAQVQGDQIILVTPQLQ